jgi:serine/threonine protein kinase
MLRGCVKSCFLLSALQSSPEMLLGARCTEKSDIYSYGQCLLVFWSFSFCSCVNQDRMPTCVTLAKQDVANWQGLQVGVKFAFRLAAGVVLWEICTGATPLRGQLRDVRWAKSRTCLFLHVSQPFIRVNSPDLSAPMTRLLTSSWGEPPCLPPTQRIQPTLDMGVRHASPRRVPDECPEELRSLMLDCLEHNPKRRPSAAQLVDRLRRMPVHPLERQAAAESYPMRRSSSSMEGSGSMSPPPASAFAAAARFSADHTPRSVASDTLAMHMSALAQRRTLGSDYITPSAAPVPGAFAGASLAPAGSLPTPFGAAAHHAGSPVDGTLPAWASDDELPSNSAARTDTGTTDVAGASGSLPPSQGSSLPASGAGLGTASSLTRT